MDHASSLRMLPAERGLRFARNAQRRLVANAARMLERARHLLRHATRSAVPPPVAMLELLSAGWLSQAIVAAAQLGIADVVDAQPRSAQDIARRLGLAPDATQRLLRALSQHGVFARDAQDRFVATALSDTLRSERTGSIRDFVLFVGSPAHREHWSLLAEAVKHGASRVASLRGVDFFDYARTNGAFGALFGRAMTTLSTLSEDYLLGAYDFSRFTTLVDVGGGEGALLQAILARSTALRGVLFDLPEVVARVDAAATHARMRVEGGSFFEAWPAGHDAYLLKHILHDWDDAPARRILERAREALWSRPDGTLLLIEMVLPEGDLPHIGTLLDLEMLLSLGGRERTRAQFQSLLESAGFTLTRVVETASPLCVLEARPVHGETQR